MTGSLLELVDLLSSPHKIAVAYHHDENQVISQSRGELDQLALRVAQGLEKRQCRGLVIAVSLRQHHLVPAVIVGYSIVSFLHALQSHFPLTVWQDTENWSCISLLGP